MSFTLVWQKYNDVDSKITMDGQFWCNEHDQWGECLSVSGHNLVQVVATQVDDH